MNSTLRYLCVAGMLAVGVFRVSGQAPFEGVIESENLTTDEMGSPQKYVMRIFVREGMVRVEIPAYGSTPGTSLIYRRDRKSVFVLNDAERSFFEMRQEPDVGREGYGGRPQIKRTGKTKRILGYTCELLTISTGEAETEFWGAKKLGGLAQSIAGVIESGSEGGSGMMNDELAAMGYFPLVVRTKMDGSVVESSEVTKIDRRKCEAALFEVPQGYRKEAMR